MMPLLHTLWIWTPTPANAVPFVILFVAGCAMVWSGKILIGSARHDLKILRDMGREVSDLMKHCGLTQEQAKEEVLRRRRAQGRPVASVIRTGGRR